MKTLLIAAFMVLGMGAISPEVSFAEEDGFTSCADDWECQEGKIKAVEEEADRKIAQEDEVPEHAQE